MKESNKKAPRKGLEARCQLSEYSNNRTVAQESQEPEKEFFRKGGAKSRL